jgi:ABC-2 type transport system ATP-binding protein
MIAKGEIIAVLGPNGSGKTTLLKIIAGLVRPDQGQINFAKRKPLIGFIPSEDRGFYHRLSALENLLFFASLYNLPPASIKKRIQDALEKFHIPNADQLYQTYSSGEKQRLALTWNFLIGVEILLLDEPTKSLDYAATAAVNSLLQKLSKQIPPVTILFSTHRPEQAEEIAHRILILNRGEFIALGTLQELREKAGIQNASLSEIYPRLLGEKV